MDISLNKIALVISNVIQKNSKMNRELMEIRPGEVYWVPLDEAEEMGSGVIHPHVVLQNNDRDGTLLVCALTSNLKRAKELGNVFLEDGEANLPKQSVVVVSQMSVVRKTQLGEYIGSLTQARVNQILAGMRFQQSIIGPRQANEDSFQ